MKQNKKFVIILSCVLVVLVAAFALIYAMTRPETNVGDKTITVEIISADGTSKEFEINTDAEFLRGALEEKDLVAGDESEFGLFVKTVDGYTANEANQEWWCFTKGGEQLFTGIDTRPIADGEHYEITLTVGYDF